MNDYLWLVTSATFLLALGLVSVVRPILTYLGAIDVPNHRSSHTAPITRGAGIALAATLIVAIVSMSMWGPSFDGSILLSTCFATAILASIVGAVEDIRGVTARSRFLLQLAVGLAGTIILVTLTGMGWWWVPVGTFAIASYINVANFMDGINGISGLHGLVVGGIFSLVGSLTGETWLTISGLLLAAVFTAFLPSNLVPNRMFLGDVGSYLLGCAVAVLAFAAFLSGINPITLAGPLVIYVADVGSTLFRRIKAGERWLEAHRSHVYQRLTNHSLSHVTVALIVSMFSLAAGLAGLLALGWDVAGSIAAVVIMGCLAVGYLLTPPLAVRCMERQKFNLDIPYQEDRQ